MLDEITNKESPKFGYHYGSIVARDIIQKYQPLVSIGGHMHEHFGSTELGKTTVINAGFGSGFGSYVNTWLELGGNKIKKIDFIKK